MTTMLCALSIKPLEGSRSRGAADAGYLNRFRLGSHCNKRSCAKTPLLMLIDILLLASSEVILAPEGQSVETTDTCYSDSVKRHVPVGLAS